MYINEFSRRLGIPSSRVRYYDQIGLYHGDRHSNNYRNYTDADSLVVYFAQMLRSMGMSIKESLCALYQYDYVQLQDWIAAHSEALANEISQTKLKLERLERIQQRCNTYSHFLNAEEKVALMDMIDGQKTYSVYTFGECADHSEEALKMSAALGQAMPYSYIAVKIPKESLDHGEEQLSVGLGLGIIEENLRYCNFHPSPVMECDLGGPCLCLFLNRENIFDLTRSDLQPLLDEAGRRNVKLMGDISGHVAFAYQKNGRQCYAFSLACHIEPLN